MSTETVLSLSEVKFGWDTTSSLLSIDAFEIKQGESVFLQGPSGSGKSTLLGLIGGVLRPRSGEILIKNESIGAASSAKRDRMRADHLGIIFQQFNLLPYLGVLANITLPCRFSKRRREKSRETFSAPNEEARHLVSELGLPDDILSSPVTKLSVGQQQRVAVARALIGAPALIIADEPTSALDSENRDRFIEVLDTQRRRFNSSLLFVSHDRGLAKHFDRVVDLNTLNNARIEGQT
ncbi:MAG: ABC transporter ATP-binding protein [Hyphomonadaceae bacterium]